eukprot:6461208-Amphidinium_carterae.2
MLGLWLAGLLSLLGIWDASLAAETVSASLVAASQNPFCTSMEALTEFPAWDALDVSPILELVAAPVPSTVDTVDMVPRVLSATHRTTNVTLEALTEISLSEDVVAAPAATFWDALDVSPRMEASAAPCSTSCVELVDVVWVLSATHRTTNATLEALTEIPLVEDVVAALNVTTLAALDIPPPMEVVAAPGPITTVDLLDVVGVLSATHRTTRAKLEALTEPTLFEDVVAAPVADTLDVAAPGFDIMDPLDVVHSLLHVGARWWRACLMYMSMHLHGLVRLALELSWMLCRSYWCTLASATSSMRPRLHSGRRRCIKPRRRAASWFDPCTQDDCMYACCLQLMLQNEDRAVRQPHQLERVQELRELVANYLEAQGATPDRVAGVRGRAHGGALELWALVHLLRFPLRVINGAGTELVRTASRHVWTLQLHDKHYTVVEPYWRSQRHTRTIKMDLLRGTPTSKHDPLIGAGKVAKGHLPWETTSTTVGLKLLTTVDVHVGEVRKALPFIHADSICVQSQGCALVLLSTFMRHKELETTDPAVLMFPGDVTTALSKNGISSARYREDEVALETLHSAEVVRRRVTLLTLQGVIQAGLDAKDIHLDAGVKHISIQPRMAYELMIELDLRWADSHSRAAAQDDWKRHCASLLGAAVQQTVGAETERLYFLRKPLQGSMMSVYSARVRMGRDLAEKALGASGRQSLFIRPTDVAGFPEAGAFSLVWATMPDTLVEQLLATVLALTVQLPGHRGLCRSASGLGVRTPWTLVFDARQLLRGGDASLTEANRSLKDVLAFTLHGIPVGVQRDELAQALAELPWAVIVHARLGRQEYKADVWHVTASAAPPTNRFIWQGHSVIIRAITDAELRDKRREKPQKNRGAPARSVPQTALATPPTQLEDPTQDAWATYLEKQGRGKELSKGGSRKEWQPPASQPLPASSSGATASSASSGTGGAQAAGVRPAAEVRVDVLAQRVSALETGQAKMLQQQAGTDGKLKSLGEQVTRDREQLEGKLDGLDKSMHQQFSEILAKLGEMSSHKARRTGES